MKITGFRPILITKDAETAVKIFEDLGFERRHSKKNIEEGNYESFIMRDANSNRMVVLNSKTTPKDFVAVSISVDNFQEAYDFFIDHGFINPRGDKVTETGSSASTLLRSPSGFAVMLSQHIRKEEK